MKKQMILIVLLGFLISSCKDENEPAPLNPGNLPYDVNIDPDNFVSSNFVGNNYFPLISGRIMVYEGEDDDGEPVRVETEYTAETIVIMGVTCVIVHDKAYVNDELTEDTDDWYAQDNFGNVWYFGEDTKELENGIVVSTHGSWKAGVDGALPGIIMFANPLSGVWYRQEYFKGEAEDVGLNLSLTGYATVPYGQGTYNNCLQVAEWDLLEPDVVEHKFYVPTIGLIKAVSVKGESDFESLKEINNTN